MGYRSKVAIRTTPKGMDMLKEAWDAVAPAPLTESCSEWYARNDVSTCGWLEIKWDSNFPEIQAIDKLLVDFPHPFSFVRIGEDMGDVEELYSAECPERYWLGAYGYIEDMSGLPIVPDFDTHEFVALTVNMYERLRDVEPYFAKNMYENSELMRILADEYDRQTA